MTRPANERGESLLEVLIAVAIMGIAVVALMAGLTTSILMSDIHRKQATAGTAVRDYAEAVQTAVAGGNYQDCGTASWYQAHSGFSAPVGYTASVVTGSLRYWTGTAWQASCSTDLGLQQLTVQVASADGRATERVDVVLRKPCGLGTSC